MVTYKRSEVLDQRSWDHVPGRELREEGSGMGTMLALMVRFGIPVAILFAGSYWLEQRHRPPTVTFRPIVRADTQMGNNEVARVSGSILQPEY
jgi:hypothetical protein